MLLPPTCPPRVLTRPVVLDSAERPQGLLQRPEPFPAAPTAKLQTEQARGSPKDTGLPEGSAEGSKMVPIKQKQSLA